MFLFNCFIIYLHFHHSSSNQVFYSCFDLFRIDASLVSSVGWRWFCWKSFLMICGESRQDFGRNRVYYIMAFIIILPWVLYFLILPTSTIFNFKHNFFVFVQNNFYSFSFHSIDFFVDPWKSYCSSAFSTFMIHFDIFDCF